MKKSRWRRNRSRNCRKKDEETKCGGGGEEKVEKKSRN